MFTSLLLLILALPQQGTPAPPDPCADGRTIRDCFTNTVTERPAIVPTPRCRNEEGFDECNERLFHEKWDRGAPPPSPKAEGDKTNSELEKKPAGDGTFAGRVGSTIADYLPLFSGFVGAPATSNDGKSLTLDLNMRLLDLGPEANNMKWRAVITQPEVSKALAQALPDNGRDEAVGALAKKQGDFDDVTLQVSWAWVNNHFGRSFAPHRALLEGLFAEAIRSVNAQKDDAQTKASTDLTTELTKAVFDVTLAEPCVSADQRKRIMALRPQWAAAKNDNERDNTLNDLGHILDQKLGSMPSACFAEPVRSRLEQGVVAAANALANRETELSAAIRNASLDRFADLVNNQPQLYATLDRRFRDELVGPKEFGAKVTFEYGAASLNHALAMAGKACDEKAPLFGANCFSHFRDAAKEVFKKDPSKGTRVRAELEYRRYDPYDIVLTEPAVSLHIERATSIVGSLAFGQYVHSASDGPQDGRIDLAASYESVSNDPLRRDRLVATLTYTQRLRDNLQLPLSVVYANHAQYLGTVDKKVSAHFGLLYKLPEKAKGN